MSAALLTPAVGDADGTSPVVLRGYQSDIVAEVIEAFDTGAKRVIMQLGTGGGKTFTAAAWLRTVLDEHPDTVVGWLVHTRGLRRQALDALSKWGIEFVDWTGMRPQQRRWQPGRVHGFGATMRLPPMLPKARTALVADECHRSAARTVAQQIEHQRWQQGPQLGLSATPARRGWPDEITESQAKFASQWDRVVCGPPLTELVAQGALAEVILRVPDAAGGDRRLLRDDRTRESGYSADSEAAYERTLSLDAAARFSAALPPRPTIWFCISTRAARKLAKLLPASAVILADTADSYRDSSYRRFNRGELRHLVSVGVLAEGVDLPICGRVMLLRPTTSRVLLSQQCGRGMRPPGDVEIVDFVRNFAALNAHPLDDLPWQQTLTGRRPSRTGGQRAAKALCPTEKCATVIDGSRRLCPTCGAETVRRCVACERPLTGREDRAHRRCIECAERERSMHRQWCEQHDVDPALDRDQIDDLERMLADPGLVTVDADGDTTDPAAGAGTGAAAAKPQFDADREQAAALLRSAEAAVAEAETAHTAAAAALAAMLRARRDVHALAATGHSAGTEVPQ